MRERATIAFVLSVLCVSPAVAQCGTTVYDSGGAGGNYANNENLTWTYCAPPGQVVTITFTAFNTEAGWDELSVHDGPTNGATQLGIFSGTALPPSITGTVPGGCITLWFTSDISVVEAGWVANLTCAPPPPPVPVCGTTVYDPGGIGGDYANNTTFTATYCPTNPGDAVTINFTAFQTEGGFDFVTIYNGPNIGAPSLGSFSGNTLPGSFSSTHPGGCITLQFTSDGTVVFPGWEALITCAPLPPPPTGDCIFVLQLLDDFGDGWGTSNVGVSLNGGPFTYYSVTAFTNQILIGVNIGNTVVLTYDASGPFQGENSYTLSIQGAGALFNSGSPPVAGVVFTHVVDCVPPPAVPQDCAGGITICNGQSFNNNSDNTGNVVDLIDSNHGCLTSDEQQGTWYYFSPSAAGTIGFAIAPATPTDYDFAVWGPMSAVTCPPVGTPLRCSYASGGSTFTQTGSYNTGLGNGAIDLTENAGGNGWVSTINVLVGEIYILYVDNFSTNGQQFSLTWGLTNGASLDCTVLPLELISLTALPRTDHILLEWYTASETNTDVFVIERSADAEEFTEIGRVAAGGNSQSTLYYAYRDDAPLIGLNYYRLTEMDRDGHLQRSSTVWTVFNTDVVHGRPFPNPTVHQAFVELHLVNAQVIEVRVVDALGRVVRSEKVSAPAGPFLLPVDIALLPSGGYFLELRSANGETFTKELIVKY